MCVVRYNYKDLKARILGVSRFKVSRPEKRKGERRGRERGRAERGRETDRQTEMKGAQGEGRALVYAQRTLDMK